MLVFISSTYRDLKSERLAVEQALSKGEAQPWGMECFNSSPEKPLSVCLEQVGACSAVVLIIGARAGSLVPSGAGLTYTGAEIEEAKRLGRPIFPFILLREGEPANDEPSGPLAEALENLRNQIRGCTPRYFTGVDDLKFEVLAAITQWTRKGRPGARKTFASLEEFFGEYKPDPNRMRYFDLTQTFVGRDEQLADLRSIVLRPQLAVAVLQGRGGIGKTKLLFELAKATGDRTVVFLRRGAFWHKESDREIPSEHLNGLVIIADDAHRDVELTRLFQTVRDLASARNPVKLILSCRPSAIGILNAALATAFDPSEVHRIEPLESLPRAAVRQIAIEELGRSVGPAVIEWLVTLSADTPLVTIAGARLIKNNRIQPAEIVSNEKFREIVFDRFIDEIGDGKLSALPRKVLELAAALSPDTFDSPALRARMAEFVNCHPHEVAQILALLEDSGLLISGLQGLRVAPDVLADQVLKRASVSTLGPTGYASCVLERFGPGGKYGQILANLSEVDRQAKHESEGKTSILDETWASLVRQFKLSNAAGRCEILEIIKRSASFNPGPAFDICRLAMDTHATEGGDPWPRANADVLAGVGEVLEAIAIHPEYAPEAMGRILSLWRLGVRGAARQARDLVRIRPDGFNVERITEILVAVEAATQDLSLYGPEASILDLIDEILEREIDWYVSDDRSIQITAYPLTPYRIYEPLRRKCFAILERCLKSSEPCIAMRALRSLVGVVEPYVPKFGRALSSEEAAWHDAEALLAIGLLSDKALDESTTLPLRQQILARVRSLHAENLTERVNGRRTELIDGTPVSDDFVLFDTFVTQEWSWNPSATNSDLGFELYHSWLDAALNRFLLCCPTASEQICRLETLFGLFEGSCIKENAAFTFISTLAKKSPEFTRAFFEYVRGSPLPALAFEIRAVLPPIRFLDFGRYVAISLPLASHQLPEVAYGVACGLTFGHMSEPQVEDLDIIENLSKHSSPNVRVKAVSAAGMAAQRCPAFAERIAAIISATDMARAPIRSEIFAAVGSRGVPVKAFTEGQMRRLLSNFVTFDRLDGEIPYVKVLLSEISQVWPELIAGLFIARFKEGIGRSSYAYWGALPLTSYFKKMTGSALLPDLLWEVCQIGQADRASDYFGRELFWALAGSDDRADEVIAAWLSNPEAKRLDVARYWQR